MENTEYTKWLKSIGARVPKNVDGVGNSSYWYHYNYLYKLVCSIIDIKVNDYAKDLWDIPYIKEHLILDGLLTVTNTSIGIIPLQSGYNGLNVFGHPTDFVIANPVLGNLQGKIGEDGEVVYLEHFLSSFISIHPLINRYAELLAQVDASLNTTLINSRVAQLFSASSQAQLKTMQKVYDDISAGKPAVFIRKNDAEDFDHVVFNNVKNTFIGNELLDVERTIINQFLTAIGINNSNTDKRERLISDEVNSNNVELYANINEWDNNLKMCTEKMIKLYPELEGCKISINYDVVNKITNDYNVDKESEEVEKDV